MIHGASDCPIPKDGALQRLLVGGLCGLGPAPLGINHLDVGVGGGLGLCQAESGICIGIDECHDSHVTERTAV